MRWLKAQIVFPSKFYLVFNTLFVFLKTFMLKIYLSFLPGAYSFIRSDTIYNFLKTVAALLTEEIDDQQQHSRFECDVYGMHKSGHAYAW